MNRFEDRVDGRLLVAPTSGATQFLIDLAAVVIRFPAIVRRVLFDTRSRYRRTLLGPFWMTIAVVVYATGYSFLVGFLFRADLEGLIPYIVTGSLIWQYVAGVINGAPTALISNASAITNGRVNFLEYVLRANLTGFVQFAHGLPVVVLVMLIFGRPLEVLPIGLAFLPLVMLAVFFLGVPLAMAATRFRDVVQITASVVQFMFYMTPIIWRYDMLPEQAQIVPQFNPLFHLVDLVRAPIVGDPFRWLSVGVVSGLVLLGFALAWSSYALFHRDTAAHL